LALEHGNGDDGQRCLGCGDEIAVVLWRLGSTLCHDCRSAGRSVDRTLLEQWAASQQRLAARHAASAGQRDVQAER
jgi:hypothetical protein